MGPGVCGTLATAEPAEWLSTNGIGGFASGTIAGLLARRYHGLLVAALTPPLGRTLLVAKLDDSGLGTLSEIFDGDPPFRPDGCIAQAWTVAEVLRAWIATAPRLVNPSETRPPTRSP